MGRVEPQKVGHPHSFCPGIHLVTKRRDLHHRLMNGFLLTCGQCREIARRTAREVSSASASFPQFPALKAHTCNRGNQL